MISFFDPFSHLEKTAYNAFSNIWDTALGYGKRFMPLSNGRYDSYENQNTKHVRTARDVQSVANSPESSCFKGNRTFTPGSNSSEIFNLDYIAIPFSPNPISDAGKSVCEPQLCQEIEDVINQMVEQVLKGNSTEVLSQDIVVIKNPDIESPDEPQARWEISLSLMSNGMPMDLFQQCQWNGLTPNCTNLLQNPLQNWTRCATPYSQTGLVSVVIAVAAPFVGAGLLYSAVQLYNFMTKSKPSVEPPDDEESVASFFTNESETEDVDEEEEVI